MSTTVDGPGCNAYLADDLDGEPPFVVHGVALGSQDVTIGQTGIRKVWPGEALRGAASTLEGAPVVKNHQDGDIDANVGKVTGAGFETGIGVIYEAEIAERKYAEMIDDGRLEVSARVLHPPHEDLEENDDGALVVDEVIEFVSLALVNRGAAPSNSVESGPHANLSAAVLQELLSGSSEGAETDSGEDETEGLDEETNGADGVDETLAEHAVHEPSWSSKSSGRSWSKPAQEDFSTDDLSEIDNHFIVSKTGFPPESYGDLSLPVVDTDGTLVKAAVDNAASRVSQVKGLSGEDLSRAESIISSLQNKFDGGDGEENEESAEVDGESLGNVEPAVSFHNRIDEVQDSPFEVNL